MDNSPLTTHQHCVRCRWLWRARALLLQQGGDLTAIASLSVREIILRAPGVWPYVVQGSSIPAVTVTQ